MYLEVIKLRGRKPKPEREASALAAAVAAMKDRQRRQALYVFQDALSTYRKMRSVAPGSYSSLGDRKRLAASLIGDVIRRASAAEV